MKRILLVDDQSIVRIVLRTYLQRHNFHCLEDVDGKGALARLDQEQPPDLIISNNQLPDMTGLQLVKTLRERIGTNLIPIILYTRNPDDGLKKEAHQAGTYAVFGNQYDLQNLVATVTRALDCQ